MHRHDLFPLSLMNLLLSSHSGIFYPYVFLYEQAAQRDSQNHIIYKAMSNGHGAECAAVKVQIRKRKHELAEINVRAKRREQSTHRACIGHLCGPIYKERRLDRPDPYPVRRGGTLLERYL